MSDLLWVPARLPTFSYDRGDPFLRTYAIGDDAARMVVDMTAGARRVAVDIETDGLAEESYVVKVIIISTDKHACVLDGFNPLHVEAARAALDVAEELDFHNSPFDVPPLVHCGAMRLSHVWKVVDTLVWANMAITDGFGGRGLADLEQTVLGISASKAAKDRFKAWAKINFKNVPEAFKKVTYSDPAYTMYAGWDGIVTHRLRNPLLAMVIHQLTNHPFGPFGLDPEGAAAEAWKQQTVNQVMLYRSVRGLAVDPQTMESEQSKIRDLQSDLEQTLRAHGVDRPTAPADLVKALEAADSLPGDWPRTATGKASTAGKYLEKLEHEAAHAFVKYGDNNRYMNYLESARRIAERTDGRLHPIVGIMKAVTGRMSYGLPAIQQFTPEAREMILADDGDTLTSVDWSQVEPVLAANFAGDVRAIETYEHSGDLYEAIASSAGVSRTTAKVVLLAAMYGQGITKLAAGLSEALERVVSLDEAKAIQAQVAEGMSLVWKFIGWSSEWSRVTGKTWTLAGRIVDVHPNFAYRGTNYTIQGSGYDLLATAVVEMHRRGMDDAFYLAFHDELIVSESAALETMEIMSTPPERLIELTGRTPILRVDRADLGSRWRTPPKTKCSTGCGSDTSMRYMEGRSDDWLCIDHQPVAA